MFGPSGRLLFRVHFRIMGKACQGKRFPICGKGAPAHCWHGGIHAKAACSIPAKKTRDIELPCLCPQTGRFLILAPSHGNGGAKRHLKNLGIPPKTAEMPRDRRIWRTEPNRAPADTQINNATPTFLAVFGGIEVCGWTFPAPHMRRKWLKGLDKDQHVTGL